MFESEEDKTRVLLWPAWRRVRRKLAVHRLVRPVGPAGATGTPWKGMVKCSAGAIWYSGTQNQARPSCDRLRGPRRKLGCWVGSGVASSETTEFRRSSITALAGHGRRRGYSVIISKLRNSRLGRLLHPDITRVQQRHALYMQRQALQRVPKAAVPSGYWRSGGSGD